MILSGIKTLEEDYQDKKFWGEKKQKSQPFVLEPLEIKSFLLN